MTAYFTAAGSIPFTVALGLVLVMAIFEILSVSLGLGLSEMVDSLLPDLDGGLAADVDGIDSASSANSLTRLLAWFRIGEVPVVMLFIIFLTGFGMSGLLLQYLARQAIEHPLPYPLAVPLALACTVPLVRAGGGILGRYMPKDETYAVSEKSFQGMVATLTLGEAANGKAAQAKLYDKHGQSHYILVEPAEPETCFSQGDQVIIVAKKGALYQVIDAAGAARNAETAKGED